LFSVFLLHRIYLSQGQRKSVAAEVCVAVKPTRYNQIVSTGANSLRLVIKKRYVM